MFIVKSSYQCQELFYSLNVIFSTFLGVDYRLEYHSLNFIEIRHKNNTGVLTLDVELFQLLKKHRFKLKSLPQQPLAQWSPLDDRIKADLIDSKIPVIYGKPGIEKKKNSHLHLNIDIFGSIFFMLSRYEEAVKMDKDQYERFPASASLAYQEGFLDRPIVNEYLEILWACIKQLWPMLKRKPYRFKMGVSCDIDHPYQSSVNNPYKQLKHIAGDLITRKNPLLAINSSINYFTTKLGYYNFDSYYNNLNWIMDVNEQAGNKVAFYFMAGQTDKNKDMGYSLDEPLIRKLMVYIDKRGHEIGLHPSYHTYKNKKQLCVEADNLRRVLKEVGIYQEFIGGRQHYLRWETPGTARNWEEAGLCYDSTLGFADQVGFRSGTCYEYPLYDLDKREMLFITEKPLIVMEGTLLESVYNGITSQNEVLKVISKLVDNVKLYQGDFNILWHNSYLDKCWYKNCYKEIINL